LTLGLLRKSGIHDHRDFVQDCAPVMIDIQCANSALKRGKSYSVLLLRYEGRQTARFVQTRLTFTQAVRLFDQ